MATDNLEFRNGAWYWRKTVNGVAFNKSTKTSDKKLAKTIAKSFELDAVKTVVLEGIKPITLKQLVEKKLASIAGKPAYSNVELNYNKFKDLFHKQTKDLSLDEVQGIVNGERAKGNKESSIALLTRYWNGLMNFAEKHKYPVGPKLPNIRGIKGKTRYLSHEEEVRFLKALEVPAKGRGITLSVRFEKQNNYDLCIALLDLGCRFHEAGNLPWSQVNFKNNTIFIKRGKEGVSSTHYMTDRLRAVMDARYAARENDDHVFPTKTGPYKEGSWFKRITVKAGLSDAEGAVTAHSLRHTFANRMLEAGLSLPEVQVLLGHKNITTTMQYLHVQPTSTAQKALAAQKKIAAAREAQMA